MSKKASQGPETAGEWSFIWLLIAVPTVLFFTLLAPKAFPLWLAAAIAVPLVIVWFVRSLIGLESKLDPGKEESIEIMNITWKDKHPAIVRELVAEDKGTNNETLFRYKDGWNTDRLMREHGKLEKQAEKIFRERLRQK